MKIKRVILNPGHGLNNATNGVYDPGAVSDRFEEATIVRSISNAVAVMHTNGFVVLVTPLALSLGAVVRWINDQYRPGDFVLSIHMNAGGGTGTEALYADNAPSERSMQAAMLSVAVASRLGLRDRGAKSDVESPRGRLAILRDTKAPAVLVEMGFIDNANDRNKVMSKGASAVIGGLQAIASRPR